MYVFMYLCVEQKICQIIKGKRAENYSPKLASHDTWTFKLASEAAGKIIEKAKRLRVYSYFCDTKSHFQPNNFLTP